LLILLKNAHVSSKLLALCVEKYYESHGNTIKNM